MSRVSKAIEHDRGAAVDQPLLLARRWIVLTTHPHREHIAVEHLRAKGFEPYCPNVFRTISHARRRTLQRRPLFPGYCFVPVSSDHVATGPIQATMGVRSVVRFGSAPATLDPAFIQALKAREIDGVIVQPSIPFTPGDKVSVLGGAFNGSVAEVLSVNESMRVTLLLHLLRRPVSWQTDAYLIEHAPRGTK
jgi:transcriptional antiterminator RfaH